MSSATQSSPKKSRTYYPQGGTPFHLTALGSIHEGSATDISIVGYGSGGESVVSSITTPPQLHDTQLPTALFQPISNQQGNEEGREEDDLVMSNDKHVHEEDDVASTIHLKAGNSPQVLLSLAYGILERGSSTKMICDYATDPIFQLSKTNKTSKSVKRFTPTNKQLHEEVMRRKELVGEKGRVSTQMGRDSFLQWLKEHPRTNSRDVTYLRQEVAIFKNSLKQVVSSTSGSGGNQWRGELPVLRFIHCLVENDSIKQAFIQSMKTLTRDELDARNSAEHARVDVWQLIADKWNDRSFNPRTNPYPTLHSFFADAIDCSYDKVATMGKCTPERTRKKWSHLRAQLLVVKKNWTKSGSGDGMGELVNGDYVAVGGVGGKKADFLGKFSPCVLYLWEICAEHGFLSRVAQQLEAETALDGEHVPTIMSARKKKRKKKEEEEDKFDLMGDTIANGLRQTAESINEITCSLLEGQLATLKDKRHEQRLKKAFLRHSDDLVPEVEGLILQHISGLTLSITDLERKIKAYKGGVSNLEEEDEGAKEVEVIAVE